MVHCLYPVFIKKLKFDVKHLTQLFKLEFVLLKYLLRFWTALFRLDVNTECIVLHSDMPTHHQPLCYQHDNNNYNNSTHSNNRCHIGTDTELT